MGGLQSFNVVDHTKRRINRGKRVVGNLELFYKHFTYEISFYGELANGEDGLLWENQYINFRQTCKTSDISGVALCWYNELKAWAVIIDINGVDSLHIYFDKCDEAKPMYELLQKYLIDAL